MISSKRELSSKLDDLLEFERRFKVLIQGGGIRIFRRSGVKSVGDSPLGLAVRKQKNKLLAYRKLTPHIEDIASQLEKFRFSRRGSLIEFAAKPFMRETWVVGR